mgnify:CR=1 FL=1
MKKIALITGGSRGIGKCIAENLAKDGFSVVLNYNKSEKILTFNKENNLIIIAKTFEQLKTNLDIFSEALNFNICNKVEDALKLRIKSLNKLSL